MALGILAPMGYLPHTPAEREAMLAALGMKEPSQLFSSIPAQFRHPHIELPEPLAEQELTAEVEALAAQNRPVSAYDNFLGAGAYWRYIPAIVRATISKPEFYSAYTPYQAEASQGTLQTIFEFQSAICALTEMDVANASLYDGATACAEAMVLAAGATSRSRIAVSQAVHPETLAVLKTFAAGRGIVIDEVAADSGVTDLAALKAVLTPEHCGLLLAQPNFYGCLETMAPLAAEVHKAGGLALACFDPITGSAIVPPGEADFDVVAGEAQSLGVPLSFGGPYCGFMAVKERFLRRIPGRLAGMTTDRDGRRAYTLTLQAREQHIRREHATSNICTNHALIALAATVYMSYMGAAGMRRVVEIGAQRAHHLAAELTRIDGFELAFASAPYLQEFVLRCPGKAAEFAASMRAEGILAGYPLPGRDQDLLVACTEMTTPAAIARYVKAAAKAGTAQRAGVPA